MDFWFEVLSYANEQKRVPAVVDGALRDYPVNDALRHAQKTNELHAMPVPEVRDWKGDPAGTAEKRVSGEDALVDVAFLAVGLKRAKAVARIVETAGGPIASGFLVHDNVLQRCFLITNYHVLERPAEAAKAEVQFNFQRKEDGGYETPALFKLAPTSSSSSRPTRMETTGRRSP